jgi:hypothetical protein
MKNFRGVAQITHSYQVAVYSPGEMAVAKVVS